MAVISVACSFGTKAQMCIILLTDLLGSRLSQFSLEILNRRVVQWLNVISSSVKDFQYDFSTTIHTMCFNRLVASNLLQVPQSLAQIAFKPHRQQEMHFASIIIILLVRWNYLFFSADE